MSLRLNRFGDFDNPSTAGFGIKVLYDGKALVLYAIGVKQYVSLPVTGVLTSHLIFWKSAPELVFHSPIY
jgi:hypothetical protein